RKSAQIRNLTENFDRWVGTMSWATDSRTIYFTAEDKGEVPIYRLDVEQAGMPQEVTRGANDDLVLTPDAKTLVFTRMSAQAPNEVYKLELGRKQAEKLSHLNDAVLSQVSMQPAEPFWFAGALGTKVEGFLIKPPAF